MGMNCDVKNSAVLIEQMQHSTLNILDVEKSDLY